MLEQLGARASIVRAHRLLLKRLGRSLLVGLLGFAVSLVLGILIVCVSVIVAVPLIIAAVAASRNTEAVVALVIVAVLVLLPIYLLVAAFLAAQESTYWTVAFRRMDIDRPPVTPYAPMPPLAPPA